MTPCARFCGRSVFSFACPRCSSVGRRRGTFSFDTTREAPENGGADITGSSHPDTRALTTAGTVEVELEILKPVTEVVFNALELEISGHPGRHPGGW